jgi:hypothetical protein
VRFHDRATALLVVTVGLCLALSACTASPTGEATAPSSAAVSSAPTSASSVATPAALTINIRIANGKVDPNGKKIDASFTLPDPGSFEVESHHLEKIIVILNVR